jgi:hypothetical protein
LRFVKRRASKKLLILFESKILAKKEIEINEQLIGWNVVYLLIVNAIYVTKKIALNEDCLSFKTIMSWT